MKLITKGDKEIVLGDAIAPDGDFMLSITDKKTHETQMIIINKSELLDAINNS